MTTPEMESFKKEMDETACGSEKHLKEIKTKTFKRDLNDAQNGKIYKWKTNSRQFRQRTSSMSSHLSTECDKD